MPCPFSLIATPLSLGPFANLHRKLERARRAPVDELVLVLCTMQAVLRQLDADRRAGPVSRNGVLAPELRKIFPLFPSRACRFPTIHDGTAIDVSTVGHHDADPHVTRRAHPHGGAPRVGTGTPRSRSR